MVELLHCLIKVMVHEIVVILAERAVFVFLDERCELPLLN